MLVAVCKKSEVYQRKSPDYESGGQEFESLRARQHLARPPSDAGQVLGTSNLHTAARSCQFGFTVRSENVIRHRFMYLVTRRPSVVPNSHCGDLIPIMFFRTAERFAENFLRQSDLSRDCSAPT